MKCSAGQLASGTPLRTVESGTLVRDFDILAFSVSFEWDYTNLLTMLELAETVIRVSGSTSEVVFEALPVDDPQIRRPDITRARELLDWEPEVALEEGLRRWLRALGREPVEA